MIEYFDNGNLAIVDGYKFKRDKKTGYFLSSSRIGEKRKRLHIYVWEKENGIIPIGYEIHHKDHDKSNNEISNLELLTKAEHKQRHKDEITDEQKRIWTENLEKHARPQAIIWHGSENGRKWHKQHYEQMKNKLHSPTEYICTECGTKFISEKLYGIKENRFCSSNCKSAFRRKSGIDNVERECECCGEKFVTNKYSKAKYCQNHRGKKRKI